ncbi:uncharacterized protein [Aegilops tauschii subsp. strangulata]|uniref:uncharacterized protein n=1 Tax=Aegilops tauschii subsp. strangulata TaxID=200361 RepID=UPI001E1C9DDE|nr:uncharacterized protein LOC120962642 [Aegilops tauschii subsp. strangulata]
MEDVARRHGGGGADLISDLPEDLLLQVLARRRAHRPPLPPVARPLDPPPRPRLPRRRARPAPLLPALASLQAAAGPGVTLLDIRVAGLEREASLVSSLLHAAAGLSPAELRLALQRDIQFFHVEMPRFHRATSIDLAAHYLHLLLSRISRFPALQRLSLSGCRVDLADLVHRCPCLRVLRVADARRVPQQQYHHQIGVVGGARCGEPEQMDRVYLRRGPPCSRIWQCHSASTASSPCPSPRQLWRRSLGSAHIPIPR